METSNGTPEDSTTTTPNGMDSTPSSSSSSSSDMDHNTTSLESQQQQSIIDQQQQQQQQPPNTEQEKIMMEELPPPKLPPNISGALASGTTPSLALARSLSVSPDQLSTMAPYDLFISQLSTDSSEARVDAMRRLYTVATAIGPDGTLDDLIPYLTTNVVMEEGEDDEILLILAEMLGRMVPGLIEGHRALSMLPILERLAAVEETVVRDKAVETMNKIVPLLLLDKDMPVSSSSSNSGGEDMEDGGGGGEGSVNSTTSAVLLATAKRLAGADWFTAKVSAAGMLPAMYSFYNKLHGMNPSSSSSSSTSDNNTEEDDNNNTFPSPAAGEEIKRELRSLYKDLSEDDTPMVRRSAARHLGRFVEAAAGMDAVVSNEIGNTSASTGMTMSSHYSSIASSSSSSVDKRGGGGGGNGVGGVPKYDTVAAANAAKNVSAKVKQMVVEELVPVYQSLGNDEQDSVRLLAVANSGGVGYGLGMDPQLTTELVLPIVKSGCVDLSWRVRHNLAKEFSTVASSMGFASSPAHLPHQTEIFSCFAGLLQDAEAEVRAAAVENIARMTQLGGPDMFSPHISPILPNLADDPVMEVRSKLAQTLMDCCDPAICDALTDRIVLSDFKPLLEGFLNDEFAEVQLHILTKLSRVSHLLSKMDAVVGSILSMAKAPNWRVREAVGRLLPHLAEARGVVFFEDHLLDPWLKLLLDQVSEVRSACVEGMPKLLSVAGASWIQREIFPHYVRIYDESVSYLTRITIVRSFASLGSGEGAVDPQLHDDVATQMLRGLDDPVANVRMVAARALANVLINLEEAVIVSRVKPALSVRVTEDEDDDCKFFAQVALDACG